MSRQDIQRLKSKDPAERKSAIRAVAKDKDRKALKQLAIMAGDDPDKELRKLAQQAGVYIRQQIGELETETTKNRKRIAVDPADAAKAQRALQAVQTYQIKNEKTKMLALLRKAVELDPNLRNDGYFISLCEGATGGDGAAAIEMIYDSSQADQLAKQEQQERRSKVEESHIEEINSVSWRAVGLDMAVLVGVTLVMTIIALLLVIDRAKSYQAALEQNQADVQEAFSEVNAANDVNCCRIVWKDDSSPPYGTTDVKYIWREDPASVALGEPAPKQFKPMLPDEDFKAMIDDWREADFATYVLVPAVVIALAYPFLLFLVGAIIHLFTRVTGGTGRMPYIQDKIGTLMLNRTVALYILLFITIYVVIGSGSSMTVFLALFGLVGAFTIFRLVGIIAAAYRVAFPQALFALALGLLPIIVVSGFGAMQAGIL